MNQPSRPKQHDPSNESHTSESEHAVNDQFFSESLGEDDNVPQESPEQLVDALEQQVAELRDRELKAQAELENFRRRILRDVDLQLKFAAMPLVHDLLDVVDNLHRATEPNANSAGGEGVIAGVKLVQNQLATVLAKYHCTPIESVGKPFDPNIHQAIAQQPSDTYPAGTVMLETSLGFMMHDRVVRPSMVIVSTGPA